jgi:hypothetical protein
VTKLFGVDIAKEIAKGMASGLPKCTLIKLLPGQRTAGDLSAGLATSTKKFPCRGIVQDFDLKAFEGTTVQKGDRQVLILGATLPVGIVPQLNDHIAAENVESEIININRDPASATYLLHVRGA